MVIASNKQNIDLVVQWVTILLLIAQAIAAGRSGSRDQFGIALQQGRLVSRQLKQQVGLSLLERFFAHFL
jgi:hypothetical protein